jgi:hypothetical protein
MKCTKCGFVSFDYLSECKQCGVSLGMVRETLGFSGNKSNVPYFLGSLLKEYVKPSADGKQDLTLDRSSQASQDFDFGDELELSGELGNMEQAAETLATAPGAAPVRESAEAEDFNLLDITDEELDILMPEDAPAAGPAAGTAPSGKDTLIPQVDIGSLPGLASQAPGPGSAAGKAGESREDDADESMIIDLSDKDLENFLSELDDSPEQKDEAGK